MISNDYYEEISNKIKMIQNAYGSGNNEFPIQCFYRGHACGKWGLTPSIERAKGETEYSVIQNAKENGEWQISLSLFENLAQLQHYNKPTRCLDYSTDPDIALYFACEKHMDEDGEIQICPYNATEAYSPNIQQITALALLRERVSVYDFCQNLMKDYSPMGNNSEWTLKQLGMNILSFLDHGFMVLYTDEERQRLKTRNPRLFNQKGTFFIFGNKTDPPNVCAATTKVESSFILPEIAAAPKVLREAIKIPIPKEAKPDIIKALAEKGITKSYLFCDK